MEEIKQLKDLEAQEGLSEEVLTEILTKRDVNKAYKILMQSALIFYHLRGQDCFETEEDYFKAFPFTVHYADGGTVAGELLRKYDSEKGIWQS